MPRKIPLTQMRDWLQSYERGKSEAAIARQARRDVRTVKKGIEQARREQDAHTARAELLKDALRKHQDDLLGVVNALLSALVMLPPGLELQWEQYVSLRPIPLAGATATYDSGKGWTITLHVEAESRWELLQQHLGRDSMWNAVAKWKNALALHIEARIALKRKTAALLKERTGYDVVQYPETASRVGSVYPAAVDLFYQVGLNRALGIADRTNPEESIVATPDGYIGHRPGGTRLAYTRDSSEECRTNILAAFKDLQVSPEAKEARATYLEAGEFTDKAKRAVEEISLLGMITGQCRVCRRLGI